MPKKKAARRRAPKAPKRSFFCRRCARSIRMPKGWSPGSASRRHYWAKHPEVMRPKKRGGR